VLEPEVNIVVGARILREYLRRFGDTEAALQMYAGAYDEPTSQYAAKVLAERTRLEGLRQKAKNKACDAHGGLFEVVHAARVGEAHEARRAVRREIDAGRRGDGFLLQQIEAEALGVAAAIAYT